MSTRSGPAPRPAPKPDRMIVTHPEDYCHRCLGKNLSWSMDNETWNAVMRGPDAPEYTWGEIICPQCFAELYEAKFGFRNFIISVRKRGDKK